MCQELARGRYPGNVCQWVCSGRVPRWVTWKITNRDSTNSSLEQDQQCTLHPEYVAYILGPVESRPSETLLANIIRHHAGFLVRFIEPRAGNGSAYRETVVPTGACKLLVSQSLPAVSTLHSPSRV